MTVKYVAVACGVGGTYEPTVIGFCFVILPELTCPVTVEFEFSAKLPEHHTFPLTYAPAASWQFAEVEVAVTQGRTEPLKGTTLVEFDR